MIQKMSTALASLSAFQISGPSQIASEITVALSIQCKKKNYNNVALPLQPDTHKTVKIRDQKQAEVIVPWPIVPSVKKVQTSSPAT